MSDTPDKAPEETVVPKPERRHSQVGAISEKDMSYRHWMVGKALAALLMRNGPYKEAAQHAVESVDKVLKILDEEAK